MTPCYECSENHCYAYVNDNFNKSASTPHGLGDRSFTAAGVPRLWNNHGYTSAMTSTFDL